MCYVVRKLCTPLQQPIGHGVMMIATIILVFCSNIEMFISKLRCEAIEKEREHGSGSSQVLWVYTVTPVTKRKSPEEYQFQIWNKKDKKLSFYPIPNTLHCKNISIPHFFFIFAY